MTQIKSIWKGFGLCLAISIPCWFLGNLFPIVGGPVFGILTGMLITLFLKDISSMAVRNQNSIFGEVGNKGLLDMDRLYSADTNTLQEMIVIRIHTRQTTYLLVADTSLFLLLFV